MLVQEMAARKNCRIQTFIDKIEYAYSAADVIVCRAGATTLAELTRLGKASVLIPYPHAAADHQTFNAQTMVDAGAAVMIADRDMKMKLKDVLYSILNDDHKRSRMNEASRTIGKADAGREIARRILELAA